MTDSTKLEREARLRWIPIGKMKVNDRAQRELNQARVDHLAVEFDPELIGTPTVNERGGAFYIIDGQHRVEALKLLGWEPEQQIQCWTYIALTEEEEAERFLTLNDVLTVHALPKFKAAVTAGREVESDIDRIVRSLGLCVSRDKVPGAIGAVGTLRRVYARSGAKVLSRTLRITRDAYGDAGLEAPVIDGLGALCERYNGDLSEETAVERLQTANGGVSGLLNKAETIRRQTGNAKAQCVAAAAVEIINRGRGGKKLPDWWKAS